MGVIPQAMNPMALISKKPEEEIFFKFPFANESLQEDLLQFTKELEA